MITAAPLSCRSLTICQAFNRNSRAAIGLKAWAAYSTRSAEPKIESLTETNWGRQIKPWIKSWTSKNSSCVSGCIARQYLACWAVVNSFVQPKWASYSSMKAIAKCHPTTAPVTAMITLLKTKKRVQKSINTWTKWPGRSIIAKIMSRNECCSNTSSRRTGVPQRKERRAC